MPKKDNFWEKHKSKIEKKKGRRDRLSRVYFPWRMWNLQATEALLTESYHTYQRHKAKSTVSRSLSSLPPISDSRAAWVQLFGWKKIPSTGSSETQTSHRPPTANSVCLLLINPAVVSFPWWLCCSHVLLAVVRRPGRATKSFWKREFGVLCRFRSPCVVKKASWKRMLEAVD